MSNIVYTTEELTLLADALINATSKHLKLEFDKGRIIGADYAQAYAAISSNAMSQAMQFLLTKDSAGIQADILNEQKSQAVDNTTVSNASVPDRIEISSNQAIMSGTQSATLLIQKDIVAEQKLHAIDQTAVLVATLKDRIDGVAAQTDLSEEQLAVMQERHGINKTPAFP